jgi:glutamyl-tRNA synthetase
VAETAEGNRLLSGCRGKTPTVGSNPTLSAFFYPYFEGSMARLHPVRVRFAPSPTGFLHIGGARTALFNYLFARHHKGKFLLRIEDTDLARSKSEMTEVILRSLKWLGLEWDEEPVFQAARTDRHLKVCLDLLQSGAAYPCFCTPDELRVKREHSLKQSGEYRYDRHCLQLSPEEAKDKLKRGMLHTLRFRVPEGETCFEDKIRGRVTVNHEEIDDFIILRSNNTPVYQIAVVVDDHDMEITHVIRGDDHLSNTPKQVLIYRALGWPLPEFAHVPMILGPDKKRLSKRHHAVSVEEYASSGFLPQTVVNFLALLGWSPGENREIFTMEDLIQHFSLVRISQNPAVLDEKKLIWMSGHYLSQMTEDQLLPAVSDLFQKEGWIQTGSEDNPPGYFLRTIGLLKSRTKTLTDFVRWGKYFFKDPDSYDEKSARKYFRKEDVIYNLRRIFDRLDQIPLWSKEELETSIRSLAEQNGIDASALIHPIRLALTGFGVSPGLFELMEVLGRERVLRRIDTAIGYLKRNPEKTI